MANGIGAVLGQLAGGLALGFSQSLAEKGIRAREQGFKTTAASASDLAQRGLFHSLPTDQQAAIAKTLGKETVQALIINSRANVLNARREALRGQLVSGIEAMVGAPVTTQEQITRPETTVETQQGPFQASNVLPMPEGPLPQGQQRPALPQRAAPVTRDVTTTREVTREPTALERARRIESLDPTQTAALFDAQTGQLRAGELTRAQKERELRIDEQKAALNLPKIDVRSIGGNLVVTTIDPRTGQVSSPPQTIKIGDDPADPLSISKVQAKTALTMAGLNNIEELETATPEQREKVFDALQKMKGGVQVNLGRPVPASIVTELSEFQSALDILGDIERDYSPRFVGPADATIGNILSLGGFTSQEREDFKAQVNLYQAEIRKLFFGTAQSGGELKLALETIPNIKMTNNQFKAALRANRRRVERAIKTRRSNLKKFGFRTPFEIPIRINNTSDGIDWLVKNKGFSREDAIEWIRFNTTIDRWGG